MRPVDDVSVRPGGSDPAETLHAYGVVPPVAANVVVYDVPSEPAGRVAVVTVTGAVTEMVSDRVAVRPAESVTFAVNEVLPVAVGIPLITPVLPSRVSPAGSEPAEMLHVYGAVPDVAASVCE